MSWTEERIDRLKAMWTKGSTASQIAEELGGVSRNAVIGKAHRLGLESRPSPVKAGEEKEKKAKAAPAPKASADVADKTSLLDLNDRVCRWPMGHPGEPDFHFCGEPSNPGYPYCVAHCGVAYQAQLPRRDRRPPPPLPYGGPRVR
jgi:GcrA cell cycle regulator